MTGVKISLSPSSPCRIWYDPQQSMLLKFTWMNGGSRCTGGGHLAGRSASWQQRLASLEVTSCMIRVKVHESIAAATGIFIHCGALRHLETPEVKRLLQMTDSLGQNPPKVVKQTPLPLTSSAAPLFNSHRKRQSKRSILTTQTATLPSTCSTISHFLYCQFNPTGA